MTHDKERSARIAALNDDLRKGRGGGLLMTTSGVKAESSAFIYAASQAVQNFDAFTEENDPYGSTTSAQSPSMARTSSGK